MKPIYKIETYTGATKDYTITDECPKVYFKEILTNQIGNFDILLPMVKGLPTSYLYNDIALNDKVKIWMGYDNYTANPQFVGKVGKIETVLLLGQKPTYAQHISGLSQGEILLRRFKHDKFYDDQQVYGMVVEWCNDLGLSYAITPTTAKMTLEVVTESYFDLLRKVSDYWINGATQIKRDFYIRPSDNKLVWMPRPFRTAGVDSLSLGTNILSYNVTEYVEQVRNDITVYGAPVLTRPRDKDEWTETLTNWDAQAGTLALETDPNFKKTGTYSIRCTTGANGTLNFGLTKNIRATLRGTLNTLYFWINNTTNPSASYLRLYGKDSNNRFELNMDLGITGWKFKEYPLGPNMEYDEVANPNGIWTKIGNPQWWDISAIRFELTYPGYPVSCWVDQLYLYPDRPSGTAYDSASANETTGYGRRELEVTDDKLYSDLECQKRAETLLYQLKVPPIQLDLTVKPGSNNLLVGDRIPITIPAKGFSNKNFDGIAVEQLITPATGFTSKITMLDTPNVRQPSETQPLNRLFNMNRMLRQLSMNEKRIG